MEHRVALELLGLDPDEPLVHDRVRRAYLRRLRAHPPERDPEGFRRLREAFELLEPMARLAEHMAEAVRHRERPAAPAGEAAAPEPERVMQLRDGTGEPMQVVMFTPPDAPARQDAPDQPDTAGASDEPSSDWPDEADTADDLEVSGEPWIDLSGEETRWVPPASPAWLDGPGEPPTLGALADELLALLERDEVDAALELANRWQHSALDDHREVSAHVAWRWALTRELLDVAAVLPETFRRTIAHGVATGELASACEAAERYRSVHPERARDLVRHLAKRAGNLHKILGSRLQPREHPAAPRAQGSGKSRAPIWVVVLIASALARASTTCNREPAPVRQLDHLQVPAVPWSGSQRARVRDLLEDPRLDPEHLTIDPETLHRLRKPIEQAPSQP